MGQGQHYMMALVKCVLGLIAGAAIGFVIAFVVGFLAGILCGVLAAFLPFINVNSAPSYVMTAVFRIVWVSCTIAGGIRGYRTGAAEDDPEKDELRPNRLSIAPLWSYFFKRAEIDSRKKIFRHTLEDVPSFFVQFGENAEPAERSKSETREEYLARLPKAVDRTRRFYFLLREQPLDYSVERKTARLVIGSCYYWRRDWGTLPLLLEEEWLTGSVWTNVFGTEIRASVQKTREYELVIRKHNQIPIPFWQKGAVGYGLGISVRTERDYARDNEKNLRLVAGVTFIDWKRHREKASHDPPELGAPLESYWYQYQIDAYLKSLHLINLATREQLSAVECA